MNTKVTKFRSAKNTPAKTEPAFDPTQTPGYQDIATCVETGDINLQEFLAGYHEAHGQDFPKGKDWLIALLCYGDDDYPIEMWFSAMHNVANGMLPEAAFNAAYAELPDDWKDNIEDDGEAEGDGETEGETDPAAGDKTTSNAKKSASPEELASNRQACLNVRFAARKAAELFCTDETLNAELKSIQMAPIVTKRGPAVILWQLLNKTATFEPKTHKVLETPIDGWPEIGSTRKTVDVGSNKLFDKFKYTDKDGTEIKGSFYEDVYADLPEGKAVLDELDLINQALSDKHANPPSYPPAAWQKSRLLARKRTWESKKRAGLNVLRDAVRLRHQWVEIENKCPNVAIDWNFAYNNKGTVLLENNVPVMDDSSEPIVMANKGAHIGGAETFRVSDILKMDIKKAVEGGAHLGALKDSRETSPSAAGAGKGKDKNKGELAVPEFKTFDLFNQGVNALASFSHEHELESDKKDLRAQIARIMGGKGRKDFVLSLGDAANFLSTLFTPSVQEEYAGYYAEIAKEKEAQAKAKMQKHG